MSGNLPARLPGEHFWLSAVFRPLVVATMTTCVLIAVLIMLTRLLALTYAVEVVVGGWLAAFVGIQSERWLYNRTPGSINRTAFRLSEVVLILAVWRLHGFLADPRPFQGGLEQLLLHPERLLDGRTMLGGGLILLAWGLAVFVSGDLFEVEVRPEELGSYQANIEADEDRRHFAGLRSGDRRRALDRLGRVFLAGGALLVACISIAASDRGGQPLTPQLALLLLTYFGLGLVVLSQARLAVLQARWKLDAVPVAPGLGRRWIGDTDLGLSAHEPDPGPAHCATNDVSDCDSSHFVHYQPAVFPGDFLGWPAGPVDRCAE